MNDYFRRKSCRLCNSDSLKSVLKLESTPPANSFVDKSKIISKQKTYPLEIHFCENCKHVQLLDVVNPSILFENYVYVSGTSPVFIKHFEDYADDIIQIIKPSKGKLIVDIGSNDGTLLGFFKKKGYKVLGIDPAKEIADKASKQGIETLNSFFNFDLSKFIIENYSKASVITANNVFAHCDDLNGLIKGVKNLLSQDGIFVFEVSYLVDVIEKTLFDTIYHEHLSYHSVAPLKEFFASNGMELFNVERINTHGGSIRGYARLRNNTKSKNISVEELINLEKKLSFDNKDFLIDFGLKIQNIKVELNNLLNEIKNKGKNIAGFGAPAKATTLMYQFGIDSDLIDFIIDDSPLKQGLYTPGLHIPVYSSKMIKEKKPDYLLILAWNFASSIINKHQDFKNLGGHFIVPLPKIEII